MHKFYVGSEAGLSGEERLWRGLSDEVLAYGAPERRVVCESAHAENTLKRELRAEHRRHWAEMQILRPRFHDCCSMGSQRSRAARQLWGMESQLPPLAGW